MEKTDHRCGGCFWHALGLHTPDWTGGTAGGGAGGGAVVAVIVIIVKEPGDVGRGGGPVGLVEFGTVDGGRQRVVVEIGADGRVGQRLLV